MGAICGILGKRDVAAVRSMANAMKHRGHASHIREGDSFVIAASSPIMNATCVVDGVLRDVPGHGLTPAELDAGVTRCRARAT